MKTPFSPKDLRAAFRNLPADKIDNKKMDEIKDELLPIFPKRKKDLNKAIADHHGISVEKFMSSPDFNVLCQKYEEYMLQQVIKKFVEKLGISEKEAWALLVYGLGLLG